MMKRRGKARKEEQMDMSRRVRVRRDSAEGGDRSLFNKATSESLLPDGVLRIVLGCFVVANLR